MDQIKRIELELAEIGRTWADMGRVIGASDQAMTNWKKRGTVSKSKEVSVANYLGWSVDQLKGVAPPSARFTDEGIREPSDAHYNTSAAPDVRGLVPVISWVQAGDWHEAEDHFLPDDADEWLPCVRRHGLHTYALRVQGDSMTAQFGKSYPAGCIIFVDPDQTGGVTSGDRVIAKINGDTKVTFKVFVEDAGRRFLKPLNPQHPVITDEFQIIGKVIGKWEDE